MGLWDYGVVGDIYEYEVLDEIVDNIANIGS